MAEAEFKVFYNNKSASREQLDRIEQITVEQEMDMAWEARLEILIGLDLHGKWHEEDAEVVRPFARVRIEINNDGKSFIPLIDGPVVGQDIDMGSQPGESKMILIVRDDSVYLNRDEVHDRFDDLNDDIIVTGLFEKCAEISDIEVDSTPSAQTNLPYSQIQSKTPMQIMRHLARRHGKHVYVLPGDSPGKSVGYFKSFPTKPDRLPELIFIGPERNAESFEVRENAERPSSVTAATIDVTDKSIIAASASFEDREFLGDKAALESGGEPGKQVLSPWQVGSDYLDAAVAAEANRSGFAYEGSGKTIFGCYRGVLRPYRLVTVKAGKNKRSGDYQITKVTHTLTRSTYEQTFNCRRDAESSLSGGGSADSGGSVF